MNTINKPAVRVAFMWAVVAAMLLPVFYYHFKSPALPYDDAFIGFRYVENFVAGKGLVYNVGEHAWGYSTVVYIFWLAMWHALFPNVALPELAARVNVVPFICAGIAVFLLVRRYSGSVGLGAFMSAVVLLNPQLLAISTGGMEPFLFLTFTLLCLVAAGADRPSWAGFLAGLAFLTRPEGAVLAPILALWFIRHPSGLVKAGVAALPLPVAWFTFAFKYYGTLVPHSVIAKNRPLYVLPRLNAFHNMLWNLGAAMLVVWQTVALLVIGGATIACFAYKPFRTKGAWALPCLFWGVFGAYSYGNPQLFEWYWPLLLVPALVTLCLGSVVLWRVAKDYGIQSEWPLSQMVKVLWGLWMVAATAIGWSWAPKLANCPNWSVARVDHEPGRLRCEAYRKAAEWVNSQRGAGEAVLAPEIGALGFYLNGSLIDACGLVSPEVIRYLPVPADERVFGWAGSIPLGLVREVQPEFIVTLPTFAQRNVLDDLWAKQTYRVVKEIELAVPTYGSDRILILRHQPR